MTLVNLLNLQDLPNDVKPMAHSGEEQYGKLLLTWRAIFNTPKIFNTYLPFLRSVAGPGVTEQNLKDVSALYVGVLNNCKYTMVHRYNAAKKNGADEDFIKKVVLKNWSTLDSKAIAILKLAEIMTLNPPLTPYRDSHDLLTEELKNELAKYFSDAELTEYAMSLAVWNALARFHRVMDFEMDMPDAPTYFNDLYEGKNK
jgi:alkylhydroperoxidase family enzyme